LFAKAVERQIDLPAICAEKSSPGFEHVLASVGSRKAKQPHSPANMNIILKCCLAFNKSVIEQGTDNHSRERWAEAHCIQDAAHMIDHINFVRCFTPDVPWIPIEVYRNELSEPVNPIMPCSTPMK
jgi:hypothetical protein